ncbi:hypothetical protein B9Z19DRAFT_1129125 [Tuber borchii]|uniref:SAP domain-containing protein n=1 Tax=Tuber borchii TaxID=42251 RepID=A0A2T6ZMU9_TUBBO|nr:hypothetical protein B9Z19DRAFT_1129125 [Tuber borchii]
MDFDSAEYLELQAACKARGIRAVGSKEDFIKRLKSYKSKKDTEFQPNRVDPEGETSDRLVHCRRGQCPEDIPAIVEATRRASTAFTEALKLSNKNLAELQLQIRSFDKRLNSLTALPSPYHHARNQFLSTFKKDKLGRATEDDLKIIAHRDVKGEWADATTDALLYRGTMGRRDFTTFKALYGLQPEAVRKIDHMETIGALNIHARVIASYDQTGSPRFYALFDDFIRVFKESGYDVGYLVGSPTEVTNAYWEFKGCIKTEVT